MPHISSYKTKDIAKITLAVMTLLCGSGIYLLFRSKSLNIYKWCSALGFSNNIDSMRFVANNWNVSEFVKFSLPDGLYCAAYMLTMDVIWNKENGWIKHVAIFLVPFITISSEVLQYFGFVKGTFDYCDLVCYAIPPIIYLLLIYFQKRTFKIVTK